MIKAESEPVYQSCKAKMPPKRKRKLTDGNKDTNAKKMKTRVPERKSQWTKGKKDLVNPTIVATSVTDSSVNPDVLADAITPQEESQDVTQGTSVSSQGVVERVQEGQIIDTARYNTCNY